MFERGLYFWRRRKGLQAVASAFSEFQRSRDLAAFEVAICDSKDKEIELRSLRKMLRIWKEKGKVPEGFIIAMGADYIQEQERLLAILGTLGNTAPFIGLFGTVIGIIKAFESLSSNLEGGANAVMGDISDALVATAVGLFVAIPAVVAYNFFMRRLDRNQARFVSQAQGIFAIMPEREGKE
jgi:biopolymer transport protein ExbB/TolQ